MTGYVGKTTNLQRDVVGQQAQAEREDQWGPMPGEVISYNAATGTVKVRPLLKKRKWDGTDLPLPDLEEVPMDFPRTAGMAITWPIPAGTRVMLHPQMRSSENYEDNDDGAISDPRSYNLSDMRATLVGGDGLSNPLTSVDAANFHMRFSADGNMGFKAAEEGKFQLNGAEGNIFDILAEVVELLGAETTSVMGGSSTGVWPLTHQSAFAALGAKLRAMVL